MSEEQGKLTRQVEELEATEAERATIDAAEEIYAVL